MKLLNLIITLSVLTNSISNEINHFGKFYFAFENDFIFETFSEESDEYPLKTLVHLNPKNGAVDTLVRDSYFISAFKKNNYEFIYSDGFRIYNYNIKNKENSLLGEFGTHEVPIIYTFEHLGIPYLFFFDGETQIISFCKVINNKLESLSTYEINGLEYHGFKAHVYKEFILFKIDGVLYLLDFEKNQLISKSEFLVKDFEADNENFLFAKNDGIHLESIKKVINKGFNRNFNSLIDLDFRNLDKLILIHGSYYYFYSSEEKLYKIENNQLKEQQFIEIHVTNGFKVFLKSYFEFSIVEN